MLIKEVIPSKKIEAHWVAEGKTPWLSISLAAQNGVQILNEMTYKELVKAIDPQFLRQGIRAEALKGVKFFGFENDTMIFKVNSSEHDIVGAKGYQVVYTCCVKFDEWDEIGQDNELTPIERARLLLWVGNVRLSCDDPSQLYWGYSWILTQLDSSIEPEDRFPKIRNPGVRGICCKHLNRVLKALPFHNADIAKEIRKQFGGPTTGIEAAANMAKRKLQSTGNIVPSI